MELNQITRGEPFWDEPVNENFNEIQDELKNKANIPTSGTWTPIIKDSSVNLVTPPQSGSGTWTIFGKQANIKGMITLTSNNMTSYSVLIALPFPVIASGSLGHADINFATLPTGRTQVNCYIYSTVYLRFRCAGSGVASADLGGSTFSPTATIIFDIQVDLP